MDAPVSAEELQALEGGFIEVEVGTVAEPVDAPSEGHDGAIVYDFEAAQVERNKVDESPEIEEPGDSDDESVEEEVDEADPGLFDDPEQASLEEDIEIEIESAEAPRVRRSPRERLSLADVVVSENALNDFMRKHGRHRILSRAEEISLARRRDAGDTSAVETLCEYNIKLLVKIARTFQGRGLPLIDLVQEGSAGLLRAAQKFDPDKGFKFSTYSTWWIKQAIDRALDNTGSTIRVPVHQHEKLARAMAFTEAFKALHGREPSDQETEEHFNWKPGILRSARAAIVSPASLERPIGDEESQALGTIIPDTSVDVVEDVVELLQHAHLDQLISSLPYHEQVVLKSYFGLLETQPMRLDEIAKKYGITREMTARVRDRAVFHLAEAVREHDYRLL